MLAVVTFPDVVHYATGAIIFFSAGFMLSRWVSQPNFYYKSIQISYLLYAAVLISISFKPRYHDITWRGWMIFTAACLGLIAQVYLWLCERHALPGRERFCHK